MLDPPALTDVHPGDPISSSSWNAVLSAIEKLYDHANRRLPTLTVKVVGPDHKPFRTAAVTAQLQGAPPRPARAGVFAGAPTSAYQLDRLEPGAYVITVEAEGFVAAPSTKTVGVDGPGDPAPLTFTLTATAPRAQVPDLVGARLDLALTLAAPFVVPKIVDAHGVVTTPPNVSSDTAAMLVLGQSPPAGAMAPPGSAIFLHIAAPVEAGTPVKVPEIRGFTLTEATAAVEKAGLKMGDVSELGGSGQGPSKSA